MKNNASDFSNVARSVMNDTSVCYGTSTRTRWPKGSSVSSSISERLCVQPLAGYSLDPSATECSQGPDVVGTRGRWKTFPRIKPHVWSPKYKIKGKGGGRSRCWVEVEREEKTSLHPWLVFAALQCQEVGFSPAGRACVHAEDPTYNFAKGERRKKEGSRWERCSSHRNVARSSRAGRGYRACFRPCLRHGGLT